jgi:hypothetical protein
VVAVVVDVASDPALTVRVKVKLPVSPLGSEVVAAAVYVPTERTPVVVTVPPLEMVRFEDPVV